MKSFLLDTNVFSELTKPRPSTEVVSFLRRKRHDVYVSVLSVGEIRRGIALAPALSRQQILTRWLDEEFLPWMGPRILPVTLDIAACWGDLSAKLKLSGRPRPVIDSLLAATALHHGLIMTTRNVADYADLEVPVINPWLSSELT